MSARREKKLRKLEATVSYMDIRVRALERRLLMLEDKAETPEIPDAEWTPAPPKPSPWRRLLDFIRGRNKP